MKISSEIIEGVLREADVEGYIELGAPRDEYASEAEIISVALAELEDDEILVENVIKVISEVWKTSFGLSDADLNLRLPAIERLAKVILQSRKANASFVKESEMKKGQKNIRQKPKFLAFEDSIIDEGIYFQNIGNDEELYHPWGKWGEGFYITKKDKAEIKIIWVSTVIFYLIMFILFKTYGSSLSFFLLPIFMNVFFIINVLALFAKCKNLRHYCYKSQSDKPHKIPKFARDHVTLAFFQFIIVLIGIVYQSDSAFLWGIGIFTAIFYLSFFYLLRIRKGYVFQNPPSA